MNAEAARGIESRYFCVEAVGRLRPLLFR